MFGRVLCLFGQHKTEAIEKDQSFIDKNRCVPGGSRCVRKDCGWKINPIQNPPAKVNPAPDRYIQIRMVVL